MKGCRLPIKAQPAMHRLEASFTGPFTFGSKTLLAPARAALPIVGHSLKIRGYFLINSSGCRANDRNHGAICWTGTALIRIDLGAAFLAQLSVSLSRLRKSATCKA
jgi:hypothetical protein